jgi:hypothetical protein
MPYRSALAVVLQRCDDLRSQVEALRGACIAMPHCANLAEALAWEDELRASLATLEADARVFGGVALPSDVERNDPRAASTGRESKALAVTAIAGLILAGAGVIAALEWKNAAVTAPRRSRILVAGNVIVAPPPAHVGDRCSVEIALDREACTIDIDAICPTIERRFEAKRCIAPGAPISARIPDALNLDGARGHLAFATDRGASIDIELAAWRY